MRWIVLIVVLPCIGLAQEPGEKVWSQEEIIAVCAKDMASLPADARYAFRYFDLSNLPPEERQTMPQILAGHINGLNREVDLVQLRPVKGAPVLRLNYEDAGWPAEVWEQLAEVEPWFHVRIEREFPGTVWPGGTWRDGTFYPRGAFTYKARKITTEVAPWLLLGDTKLPLSQLILGTGTKAPIVRADWFLNQTAIQEGRKPGYYDFLGVKNQKDFEKLVRFDGKLAKSLEHRRIVIFSGIALQVRRIDRTPTVLGAEWSTFDNERATGQNNPLQVLNGGLGYDATEKIAPLPSGWPAFYLGNSNGERQDKAPDNIVGGDRLGGGNDTRLHINLSCIRCHMQGKEENVLKSLDAVKLAKLESPVYEKLRELQRLYQRDIDPLLKQDRENYKRVIVQVTGMEPHGYSKSFGSAFSVYEDAKVGLSKAAKDMGMAEKDVRKGWQDYQKKEKLNQMIDLILQGGEIPIRQWEEVYPLAQLAVRGLKQ